MGVRGTRWTRCLTSAYVSCMHEMAVLRMPSTVCCVRRGRSRTGTGEDGASWDAEEGIDRARHTLASFFKSYLRGVVPRLVIKFNSLNKLKRQLRLEEALRL